MPSLNMRNLMTYARISFPPGFIAGLLLSKENTVTVIKPQNPDGDPATSAPLLKDNTIGVTRQQLQGLYSGEMGLSGLEGRVVSIQHIGTVLHTSPECAADTLRDCFGRSREELRKSMAQAAAAYYRHAHNEVTQVERDLTLYNTPLPSVTWPLVLPPLAGLASQVANLARLPSQLKSSTLAILKHGEAQAEVFKPSFLRTSQPPYSPLSDQGPATYTIPAHIGSGLINTETLSRYAAWTHGSPVSIDSSKEASALYLLARSLMNPRLTALLLPYCEQRTEQWLPSPDEVAQRLDATSTWQEVSPLAERYIQQLEQQARFLAKAHHLQGEQPPPASAASAEWVASSAPPSAASAEWVTGLSINEV